jgi:hypothetical protein
MARDRFLAGSGNWALVSPISSFISPSSSERAAAQSFPSNSGMFFKVEDESFRSEEF